MKEMCSPLSRKQKISLVGTLAANSEEVIGAWAMSWKREDCVTILDGLKRAGADVTYYPCGGPEGRSTSGSEKGL